MICAVAICGQGQLKTRRRLVHQRKEGTGRLRFLGREESKQLHKVIAERFLEHLTEFVLSVNTGMRLSE